MATENVENLIEFLQLIGRLKVIEL